MLEQILEKNAKVQTFENKQVEILLEIKRLTKAIGDSSGEVSSLEMELGVPQPPPHLAGGCGTGGREGSEQHTWRQDQARGKETRERERERERDANERERDR